MRSERAHWLRLAARYHVISKSKAGIARHSWQPDTAGDPAERTPKCHTTASSSPRPLEPDPLCVGRVVGDTTAAATHAFSQHRRELLRSVIVHRPGLSALSTSHRVVVRGNRKLTSHREARKTGPRHGVHETRATTSNEDCSTTSIQPETRESWRRENQVASSVCRHLFSCGTTGAAPKQSESTSVPDPLLRSSPTHFRGRIWKEKGWARPHFSPLNQPVTSHKGPRPPSNHLSSLPFPSPTPTTNQPTSPRGPQSSFARAKSVKSVAVESVDRSCPALEQYCSRRPRKFYPLRIVILINCQLQRQTRSSAAASGDDQQNPRPPRQWHHRGIRRNAENSWGCLLGRLCQSASADRPPAPSNRTESFLSPPSTSRRLRLSVVSFTHTSAVATSVSEKARDVDPCVDDPAEIAATAPWSSLHKG